MTEPTWLVLRGFENSAKLVDTPSLFVDSSPYYAEDITSDLGSGNTPEGSRLKLSLGLRMLYRGSSCSTASEGLRRFGSLANGPKSTVSLEILKIYKRSRFSRYCFPSTASIFNSFHSSTSSISSINFTTFITSHHTPQFLIFNSFTKPPSTCNSSPSSLFSSLPSLQFRLARRLPCLRLEISASRLLIDQLVTPFARLLYVHIPDKPDILTT